MKRYLLFTILATACMLASSQNSTYQNIIDEGFKALTQQDIPTAITYFQDAYNIDSTKVEACYGLGVAYNFFCKKTGSYCKESLFCSEQSHFYR